VSVNLRNNTIVIMGYQELILSRPAYLNGLQNVESHTGSRKSPENRGFAASTYFRMWGWCQCLLAGVKSAKVYCIFGNDCQIGTATIFWDAFCRKHSKRAPKIAGILVEENGV
jgi:hypothetical protein